MLAGCGGSPANVAPATLPALPAHRAMRTDGGPAKWALLYVSNANGTVTVYRYWQLLYDATLTGFEKPKGECTDGAGDVFITDSALEEIVEYHHGATTAANTVVDAGYQPYACSVDPTTGNLAVANDETAGGKAGDVAVYAGASGKATHYAADLDGYGPLTCGYDDDGNLLIATEYGYGSYEYALFAMLPKNGRSFKKLKLAEISRSPFEYVTNVQWDGKYWAVTDNGNILRFTIAQGGSASYEGATELSDNWTGATQVWISNTTGAKNEQANQMVAAEASDVLFWAYPAGGSPYASIEHDVDAPYGVTISPKLTH
jgi:hypothetical protein